MNDKRKRSSSKIRNRPRDHKTPKILSPFFVSRRPVTLKTSSTKSVTGKFTSFFSDPLERCAVPSFGDVWPLLQTFGYYEQDNVYYKPGVNPSLNQEELTEDRDYFTSVGHLRRYLCAYGLDFQSSDLGQTAVGLRNMGKLQKWIRFAIVQGLHQSTIPPVGKVTLKPAHVCCLLKQIGFTCVGSESEVYLLPGESDNSKGRQLSGEKGLEAYLARFGLPKTCHFNNISEAKRLQLEIYLTNVKDLCTL
jgi:hypothetical protein